MHIEEHSRQRWQICERSPTFRARRRPSCCCPRPSSHQPPPPSRGLCEPKSACASLLVGLSTPQDQGDTLTLRVGAGCGGSSTGAGAAGSSATGSGTTTGGGEGAREEALDVARRGSLRLGAVSGSDLGCDAGSGWGAGTSAFDCTTEGSSSIVLGTTSGSTDSSATTLHVSTAYGASTGYVPSSAPTLQSIYDTSA